MTDLQRALRQVGVPIEDVTDVRGVGGGCISDATRVTARNLAGQRCVWMVKSNSPSFLDNFQAEWEGLVCLSRPGVITVPQPIAVGTAEGKSWLVTDWIEQGSRSNDYFERFGASLAELHRATLGTDIGFRSDNFLGSARQINSTCDTWTEFFATHRIEYQIRWAMDQGLADAVLQRDCRQIVDFMDRLLEGREDQTSLLHGDLWSGNYLCDSGGNPVIIDPAVYYGCREAEFGMLRLFGSCPASFYDAYVDAFPLPGGWQHRTSVYVLYHLLNHLNLFGRGYHDQCRSLAAEILRG